MENGLLDHATLAQRASYLRLTSLSLAEGIRSGPFRSVYRAQGIEFSGVREYLAGDDIRAIDWNVTARMGKPFIKLFDEERELTFFLVLDRSLSMETGTAVKSRLQVASEVCALLAFAAEQMLCPVGAVFFDGEIQFSSRPKAGREQIMRLIKNIDLRSEQKKQGSALDLALKGAYRLLKNRSLVVVVSDFRSTGYETELARLAVKHDVLAVRITDPADFALSYDGCIPFYDPESGHKELLPAFLPSFQRNWRTYNEEHLERWELLCKKRGVWPLIVSTTDDPAFALSGFFSRERRK